MNFIMVPLVTGIVTLGIYKFFEPVSYTHLTLPTKLEV